MSYLPPYVNPKRPRIAIRGLCATLLSSLLGCSGAPHLQPPSELIAYPPPPAQARAVYLTTINDSRDAEGSFPSILQALIGRNPQEVATVHKPFGLAARDGKLWVCDTGLGVVHEFDFPGRRYRTLGSRGRGRLAKPIALATDDEGRLYVADTARSAVICFSPEGHALRTYGSGKQFKPTGLAIDARQLYVVNGALHRVEVYGLDDGRQLRTWGRRGRKNGQFHFPNAVVVHAGKVYVTDMLNFRVQVFDTQGKFLSVIGSRGANLGQFERPKHLAVAPDGRLYVVDAGIQRVQVFDADGKPQMALGRPGPDPGCLALPAGVCTDRSLLDHFRPAIPAGFQPDYLIFVASQFGQQKINVYAFGQFARG